MADNTIQLKVDVEVLKTQVSTLTSLCTKMDTVIEKLVDQQEKYTAQIYKDMENRRIEKNAEIKEIHDRIDTVIDKVQITELRIMDEIKQLRAELTKRQEKDSGKLDNISSRNWMIVGGIIVMAYIISHAVQIIDHLTK
jgi:uncharacterized phage infection (PIP) family protein YhgE